VKRTLIDLPEKDIVQLDELARAAETSRASILREAVSEYLIRHDRPSSVPLKPLQGFGQGKGNFGDGVAYQRAMRAEWNREGREP